MKIYGIDYTKISEAESSLYSATRLMANDHDAALKRIEEARKLLQEFLKQNNLVEDDNLADGLVRQSETFDEDQLDFIRDIFANLMTDSKQCYQKEKANGVAHPLQEEELAIINVCQKQLGNDEFDSVEQFYRNKSNTWTEIIEEKENYQEQAEAVVDWLNSNPDWNNSELCKLLSEHNMEVYNVGDIICRNEEYIVFRALKGYCYEERELDVPYK